MQVQILDNRQALGETAAADIAESLRAVLSAKDRAVILLAAAPSQNETLTALAAAPGINWTRITALHLDEYLGLPEAAPASFRRYVREHVVTPLGIREFHGLAGDAADPAAECARYARLLAEQQPDLALLGIGENGHLAFIDPPWCNFADPDLVRVVPLDDACRTQQVADGCFSQLEDVPKQALSLTIPAMLRTPHLFVMVPGARKADAVRAALEGPLTTACPASILRTHAGVRLYLDRDSAGRLTTSWVSG
ncbi:MAG: glucosamine-6-phosphate deaminase [Bryobacteraceae bacterium]